MLATSAISLTAFGEESQQDTAQQALDCTLYTKPYTPNEHGAYVLPAGLNWRVMPHYVGRTERGKRIVDDRLTLVLNDAANSFWPVIAKMSIDQAESLQQELARVIAQKRDATTEP